MSFEKDKQYYALNLASRVFLVSYGLFHGVITILLDWQTIDEFEGTKAIEEGKITTIIEGETIKYLKLDSFENKVKLNKTPISIIGSIVVSLITGFIVYKKSQ
jgi:hypothetical protein